jgi:hypothetical protein
MEINRRKTMSNILHASFQSNHYVFFHVDANGHNSHPNNVILVHLLGPIPKQTKINNVVLDQGLIRRAQVQHFPSKCSLYCLMYKMTHGIHDDMASVYHF